MHRCNESMLHRLLPEVVEEHVGHIDLAHLGHTHGDDSDQDEPGHVGFQLQEICQKPYGQESHHRPEEDLEEAENISLRHDPILKHKGPYLNQFLLQIR